MTGHGLRSRRPAGLARDNVAPLLRVVNGQQTSSAVNDQAQTPSRTSQKDPSPNRSTTPPPQQLTETEIYASPKSTSSEDEESSDEPGEAAPAMKQRYSETLKPSMGKPLRGPRRLSTAMDARTPQRSFNIGASPKSLKRPPPDDPIVDGGIFGFEGPSKRSRGYGSRNAVYGNGAKKKVVLPKSENFHAKRKGTAGVKNGAKSDEDSDAESKPASSRKPLSNTTNTLKLKSLGSPKSAKKVKAKLHILGDPDALSAPVSSLTSNGASPARSIKSIKSERSPNSDLSSPPSSAQLDLDEIELEDELKPVLNVHGNYDQPVDCPMCGRPVDAEELSSWQRRVGRTGRSMRIGDQMAFCEAHKTTEAQQEYAARSYPAVDFDTLPGRIERFRDDLLGVLHATRPSHFRAHTSDAAAKGQLRNLAAARQNDQMGGMSVGYYGPRGRRIMERWVTTQLAETVRERAAVDRLIAFKTPAGFMQEVLVPELATWLIMEDMRRTEDGEETGEARAREILEESGPVGDIVHRVVEGEDLPREQEHVKEEWDADEDVKRGMSKRECDGDGEGDAVKGEWDGDVPRSEWDGDGHVVSKLDHDDGEDH